MSRLYNPTSGTFVPDEPLERHNLSLVTHDIAGNMPNKFRKDQPTYHREVEDMYPHARLAGQGENSRNLENRSMPPFNFIDERTGNARNPGQSFKNSASQILDPRLYERSRNQQAQHEDPHYLSQQYDDSRNVSSDLRRLDKYQPNPGMANAYPQDQSHEKAFQDRYREVAGRDLYNPNTKMPQNISGNNNGQSPGGSKNYRQKFDVNEQSNSLRDGQNNATQNPQFDGWNSQESGVWDQQGAAQRGASMSQGQDFGSQNQQFSDNRYQNNSAYQNSSAQQKPLSQSAVMPQQGQNQGGLSRKFLTSQELISQLPAYKSPPVKSEYKESFYNLYGNQSNLSGSYTYRGVSASERSKVFPVHELDFVKKRRHYEIYNKFTDIPEDVRNNPNFYITQSNDQKYHIYDLLEIERKMQRAGLTTSAS